MLALEHLPQFIYQKWKTLTAASTPLQHPSDKELTSAREGS